MGPRSGAGIWTLSASPSYVRPMLVRHASPLALLLVAACSASTRPAHPSHASSARTSGAADASGPSAAGEHSTPPTGAAGALARAFEARLTVWTRPDGTRVLTRRCRNGPVPCRQRIAAFAEQIRDVAARYDLDPFLLGALAMSESGLDPSALGPHGEAGLVQLHPRGAGRGVRYVQDADYRRGCQERVGACQGPVLERGARTLAEAVRDCHGLLAGLGAYATGHCTREVRQAHRVLEERERLRELSR